MGGQTMETNSKRSNWFGRLLFIPAVVMGVMLIGMPPHHGAGNTEELIQERDEPVWLINKATLTWQNFMQDPDLSGFRAHVKGVKGVLIFPKLMKGAFVFGMEGGNGVLIV